jgi:hypothetical protein
MVKKRKRIQKATVAPSQPINADAATTPGTHCTVPGNTVASRPM